MSTYRIPLDGGGILVVDLRVEPATQTAVDPTSFGAALLDALGLNRVTKPSARKASVSPPPVEPDADEWLEQTSRAALKGMK